MTMMSGQTWGRAELGREVRGAVERVLMRAAWLDEPDRVLLEQVLGKGVRPGEVAVLSGVTERAVQRRVEKLVARLRGEEAGQVLRFQGQWPEPTASVGLAVFVKGWSLRKTAEVVGLSLHRVRQEVGWIRGRLEGVARKREGEGRGGAW